MKKKAEELKLGDTLVFSLTETPQQEIVVKIERARATQVEYVLVTLTGRNRLAYTVGEDVEVVDG